MKTYITMLWKYMHILSYEGEKKKKKTTTGPFPRLSPAKWTCSLLLAAVYTRFIREFTASVISHSLVSY